MMVGHNVSWAELRRLNSNLFMVVSTARALQSISFPAVPVSYVHSCNQDGDVDEKRHDNLLQEQPSAVRTWSTKGRKALYQVGLVTYREHEDTR